MPLVSAPHPKLDSISLEVGSAGGGGCLGPAGLSVRSRVTHHLPNAAWHCAQDPPPPTLLLVPLLGDAKTTALAPGEQL